MSDRKPALECPPASAERTGPVALPAKLLHVAWLSILLGLLLEGVLLTLAAALGTAKSAAPFVADLVQKVSWSSLVCLGLALGTAAGRAARGALMGLMGLLAAPAAFHVARTLHKAASEALKLPPPTLPSPAPWLIAGLKALEYACLGMLVGWLSLRPRAGLAAHAGAGAVIGLTCGGLIVWTMVRAAPAMPAFQLLARCVNEMLFPIGCALVLYAADRLGRRLAPSEV